MIHDALTLEQLSELLSDHGMDMVVHLFQESGKWKRAGRSFELTYPADGSPTRY
jgi:hypothetical protein